MDLEKRKQVAPPPPKKNDDYFEPTKDLVFPYFYSVREMKGIIKESINRKVKTSFSIY